mmetsp:Transcript_4216/g.8020  ORF Transcript_4216/g.8020 Transcript_4216/m.8020 type:complete len:464 (-) Transcript_4216:165-1556(-)
MPLEPEITKPTLAPLQVAKVFREIDLDHNGMLSKEEVSEALHRLRLPCSCDILDEIFDMADPDLDNRIDFAEFSRYVCTREKQLLDIFHEIDVDQDGHMVVEELTRALEQLHVVASEKEIKKIVRRLSTRDESVAFREFRDMLLLLPVNSLKKVFDTWERSASVDTGDNPTIPDEIEGGKPAYLVNFVAGGIAGAVSRTITAPMDRLKLMMQAQAQGESRSILSGLKNIYKDGGAYSFWKGNGTNVIKIIPESATKFVSYEWFKNQYAKDPTDIQVSERFVAGAGAGIMSQLLIYPLEIAKTRLALSAKDEFSGISHCLNRTIRNEGFFALYRGLGASLLGVVPYCGIDLGLFMTFKEEWIRAHPDVHHGPGPLVLLAMGGVSSTCGAIVAYPAQLVRTRLQAQGMNAERPEVYSSVLDCVRKTVQQDGITGLYRGLWPNLLKTFPSISTSYLIYEKTRSFLT